MWLLFTRKHLCWSHKTSENVCIYLMVSFPWSLFSFTYNISLASWEINSKHWIFTRVNQKKIKSSRSKYVIRTCHFTNERHFPKTISHWEFNYGLFTTLQRIIVPYDFCPSSFKLKRDILPLLTKCESWIENYLSYEAKNFFVN